jgi:branched-subunit amino acid ABC-type transport system permease component
LLQWGVPYWAAFILTVALSFLAGIAIERAVFRPIRNAPVLSHVVVFIALFAILNSLAGFIWDFGIKPFPTPFGTAPLLGSGLISAHQAGMIGVTVLVLILLYGFFRYTSTGLAMRAAASNPESARLVGIRVGWMVALGWGMAAAIGAVGGLLIAPVVFLDPNMMLGILLYGFAGAVLGGLTSPGGAVIGGLTVGVPREPGRDLPASRRKRVEAPDRAVHHRHGPGGKAGRPLRPRQRTAGLSMGASVERGTAPRTRSLQGAGRTILIAGLLVAVALPFGLKGFVVFQLTMVLIYAIAIVGLNLLTGFNGQFSLGHGAFYALGAYTAAILMEHGGVPYVWTLPLAGGLCFVAGFLFGLPALRLEAIYLALATFALAVATPQILKLSLLEPWTGGSQGIVILKPDPPFGLPVSQDQWLYFLHPSRRPAAVLGGPQPGEQPDRARDDGHSRQPDCRTLDGHQHVAAQDAHLRPERILHRRRRRPRSDRRPVRRAGQLRHLTLDRAARRTRRRRGGMDPRRALRRRLRALRAECGGGHLQGPVGAAYGAILIFLIYSMPSGVGGVVQLLKGRVTRP